jgi:tyrosyl-tRNA synthetase
MVHGEEGLREALAVTERMFGGGEGEVSREALAGVEVPELDRGALPGWPAAFVAAGLAASNGEARRLIAGGGLYAGDRKIGPDDPADFPEGLVVLRKGRKTRVPVLFV